MSEQTTAIQPQPPVHVAPTLTAADILLAIKENFVVLSAAAGVFGITVATTFFGAYLWVFDWRLLWYVQYTDVLTFGVIAIGVLSGSLATLQGATHTLLNIKKMEGRKKRRWIYAICFIIGTITALNVWSEIHNGQPYWHTLFGSLVLGLGIFLIFWVISLISAGTWPTALQVIMLVLSCILGSVSFGNWLGFAVQEAGIGQEVVVKDKVLSNVKVIAVLARHTILLQDKYILVVPTADISLFKSQEDPILKTVHN